MKGLIVVALPTVALVAASGLVLFADHARTEAHRRVDASDRIDASVGRVRDVTADAFESAREHFSSPSTATQASLTRDRAMWRDAVVTVEEQASAHPDAELGALATDLRATMDAIVTVTDESLRTLAAGGDFAEDLWVRSQSAVDDFEAALSSIEESTRDRALAAERDFDRLSERTTTFMLASAVLGILGAVAAMLVFALAIGRRVRQLEANAVALGDGLPLAPLPPANDELGHLSRGLERAAVLLREREHALAVGAETLRASQENLSLALEAGAMGTWDVDLRTGRSVWDERSELDHGLAPGTFAGTAEHWMELVHPDDRERVWAASNAAVANGGRWTVEYRTACSGGARWIGTSGWALRDGSGAVVRLVGVGSDITARRQGEDALRHAIAAAEQANTAKTEFLSRMSHELRTPLNAILGFGQLLEMDELSADQRESVSHVLGSGRHLLGLIDDVLDISCIESGTLTTSLEPVGVGEVFAETAALVSALADARNIRVEVADNGAAGVHVRADRRRLTQILVNLVTNAIKYNVVGGRVELGCASSARGIVTITVRDTGIGIATDHLERLFTPFDRLGAEQTTIEGTGIGLPLAQRLAELLGSTLRVESNVGRGSTFSLDLVAVDDPAASAEADDDDERTAAGDAVGRTILYVEDNPSNLRLVERLIGRRGDVTLVTAGSGELALDILRTTAVDLILLDLHLPGIGGDEVLARVRQDPRTLMIPVAVVTADASPSRAHALRAAGAGAVLTKPLDLQRLAGAIDDLLLEEAS